MGTRALASTLLRLHAWKPECYYLKGGCNAKVTPAKGKTAAHHRVSAVLKTAVFKMLRGARSFLAGGTLRSARSAALASSAISAVAIAEAEDNATERFAAKVRDLTKSAGLDGANLEGLAGMDVESMRTFGVSGLMGACSGYALKRVGRVIIFSIGAVFASLQLATQYGYLTVNWNKVERDLHIDADCVASGSNTYLAKAAEVLRSNLPSAGTFTACFLLAFRRGY